MKSSMVALVLAALLGLWSLGGHDLWAPDEPYFAEGAREMIADGEWAVPHVNGVVSTDKPPLFFWVIALFSLVSGGVTSWTARLPSVMAALGSVALTIRLGWRMAGPRAGGLAGLLLATTYLHWDKARSAQIDALLSFLILTAIVAFESFRSHDSSGTRAGLLFWASASLAVLAKGPVGLLLPLGIALATLAFDGDIRAWGRFAPLSGPLLFAGVVGSWAVVATLGSGGEYSVWGALKEHFVERAAHGMHHAQPPWYYLKVLPIQLLPWSGLVLGGLLLAWKRRRAAHDRFLLVFSLFVVLFFSVSTEKRDLYVLPAYAAFALLAARLVAAVEGWESSENARRLLRWVTVPQGVVGVFFFAFGVVLPLVADGVSPALVMPSRVLGPVMIVGGAAIVGAGLARRPLLSVYFTAGMISAAYLIAVTTVQPAMNPMKSSRDFALELKEATAESRAAGNEVLALDIGNLPDGLSFYSDGVYLRETGDPSELEAHLTDGSRAYAVVSTAAMSALPREFRGRLSVVASAHLSRKKVLLITSRPGP